MRYVPDTRFVLHHVEEEDEVFQLYHHSEKFTTANLGSSAHLLVLHFALARTCGCVATATLSFTKFIAKITRRAIIARDAICFYHNEDDHLLLLGLLVMPGVSSQQMDWVLFSCNRPNLHYCKRCLKSSGCACYYDPTLSFGYK